jgi:nucleoside-diphosphate-sugar epimerase
MKVTVLGGLGYIGSHLIDQLTSQKYDVTILDINYFGDDHIKNVLDRPNCSLIEGDIRHAEDLSKSISGSDTVIHLAGLVGDPACSLDEEETWLHNIESSRLIADICNHYGVNKFFFASSCSVYGAAPSDILLNEGSYLNPVSLYAQSKIESENIFKEKLNCCYSALRLSTVFGYSPRMRFDLVINLFVMNAVRNKKLEVFGGKQFRPFIHCADVARAFIHLMNAEENKINGEAFNVCSENISIRDLGILVSKLVNGVEINFVDQKEDNRNYKVSADKAKWLLNYEPELDLKSGIIHMISKVNDSKFDDWKENTWKYVNIDNLKMDR